MSHFHGFARRTGMHRWIGWFLGLVACSHGGLAESMSASAPAVASVSVSNSVPDGAQASVPDGGTDAVAELDSVTVERPIGPFETKFSGSRNVYFAIPDHAGKHRLIANLHGICNPPGYACGYWTQSGSERGFLVCPEGNSTCGGGGPPSWDESLVDMDKDLEKSIDVVSAQYPGEVVREGAILTGFSRGAWAAPTIAAMHPGRWRYLILNEADVTLTKSTLEKAGVRAVVLMAGQWGTQIAGERATVAKLQKEGFPAMFIMMPSAGHYYSANIDELMRQAMQFVIQEGEVGPT